MAVTLTGKITDVTGRPIDDTATVAVKAPTHRIGSPDQVIVSGPAPVDSDGEFSITVEPGDAWLYVSGRGWSDSIKIAVTTATTTISQAIANASSVPGIVDYLKLISDAGDAALSMAKGAVDEAVSSAVDEAVSSAVDDIKWVRRDATTDDVFSDLGFGLYGVPTGGVATALGLPAVRYGTLEIKPARVQAKNVKTAVFTTNQHGTAALEVWVKATDNIGVWKPWEKLFPTPHVDPTLFVKNRGWYAESMGTFRDLEDGLWEIVNGVKATAADMPVVRVGLLEMHTVRNARIASFTTNDQGGTAPLEVWKVATSMDGAVWGDWKKVYPPEPSPSGGTSPSGSAPLTGGVDAGLGHAMHRQRLIDRHNGLIDVGSATPICFVWDDYPDLMQSRGYIDEIKRLGLKINFALPSQTFGEMSAALGGQETTFTDVNSWIDTGLVEVSNHSRRHRPASTEEEIYREIVGAKKELEEALTSQESIDTWVQPATDYPGFSNGLDVAAYSETLAGRLIAAHHGFFTGSIKHRPDASVRMTGDVSGGLARLWVDSRTTNRLFGRERIEACYGTNLGYILGTHASVADQDDRRWTHAESMEFLQWLAGERDAGRIELLFLSEWPFAVNSFSNL